FTDGTDKKGPDPCKVLGTYYVSFKKHNQMDKPTGSLIDAKLILVELVKSGSVVVGSIGHEVKNVPNDGSITKITIADDNVTRLEKTNDKVGRYEVTLGGTVFTVLTQKH